jgi:hypothetical protein
VTYAVVGFLKRREGVEVFDTDTDFSPFARSGGGDGRLTVSPPAGRSQDRSG